MRWLIPIPQPEFEDAFGPTEPGDVLTIGWDPGESGSPDGDAPLGPGRDSYFWAELRGLRWVRYQCGQQILCCPPAGAPPRDPRVPYPSRDLWAHRIRCSDDWLEALGAQPEETGSVEFPLWGEAQPPGLTMTETPESARAVSAQDLAARFNRRGGRNR